MAGIFLWVSGKLDSYEVELEKQSYELMEVEEQSDKPMGYEEQRYEQGSEVVERQEHKDEAAQLQIGKEAGSRSAINVLLFKAERAQLLQQLNN